MKDSQTHKHQHQAEEEQMSANKSSGTSSSWSSNHSSSFRPPTEYPAPSGLLPPSKNETLSLPTNVTRLPYPNSSSVGGGQTGGSFHQHASSPSEVNMAILISLTVMIIVLFGIFAYLIVPPLVLFVKRRIPVDPKKVEARYATIEGWLISKVCRSCSGSC